MVVLIIGLGSIAKKHIDALRSIDSNVNITALRSGENADNVDGVVNIYEWNEIPKNIDFVIISNLTSEHYETILKAIELNKPLFIEKPPVATIRDAKDIEWRIDCVLNYVAFSLRFHPVIRWLKSHVDIKKVIEVNAYCGSYLPEWRPGSDYRKLYSSKKELGGGVHLDLIHELDYIIWIFGIPKCVNGFLSKVSDLELNAPDCAHYWLEYEKMNASITLNYYRKDSKRNIEIVFNNETWSVDLLAFTVKDSSGKLIFESQSNFADVYREQMNYFLNTLKGNRDFESTLKSSIPTLESCLNVKISQYAEG